MKQLFMAFVFVFGGLALSAEEKQKDLVLALKPNKNPEKMLQEKTKLEAELTKTLGRKVKVIIPLSSAVILQGFRNGTIDVGYISSVDMVNAQRLNAADILLAGEIKGRNFYESVWLVKKDSKFKSISDLKDRPVAFASRTSTSGYLIPYWNLIKSKALKPKQDPAVFFGKGNVYYGKGYVSAVKRVLQGQAEAAAVSDYVYFGNKHLSDAEKGQLRVLQKQGPVPSHMLAVRKSMKSDERELLKNALVGLNKKPTLRDQIFSAKFVTVNPTKHLSSTREALELTGFKKKR